MNSLRLAMVVLTTVASFHLNAQNQNIVFRSKMSFPGQTIANVCGYAADGREYALLGGALGLIIVDVTDPDNPVEIKTVDGPNNLWKEIKTYSHYAYTVSEGGQGINIVDLANLPSDNLDSYFYVGDGVIEGGLQTLHSLHIDVTKGFLYAYGSNLALGGAVVFDLNQDPYHPKYVGQYNQLGYVHDGYVDNDTLYASHIGIGLMAIVDMTNKAAPLVINTQQTTNSFTHNTWLSEDHKTVFTTDETPNSYVTAYDISDPTDIKYLDKVQSNPGSNSIGHNTHIRGNYAITAWYRDGVTIVDATNPANLVQVGNYDTYPQGEGDGFDGCWGVYPFLPSGNLIVSNIDPGEMYVLTPTYVRAAYLEGTITDAQTGNPISGALVEIVGLAGSDQLTNNIGAYAVGQAQAGSVDLKVTKLGYITRTVTVDVQTGVTTTLNVDLIPSDIYTISGTVTEASSGLPVPNAAVYVHSTNATLTIQADANGNFLIPGLLADQYDVVAGAWGYQYKVVTDQNISSNEQLHFALEKGYQDDFVFDYGWTVSGTSATGIWERAEPVSVQFTIYYLVPETDIANDVGDLCMVTGNSSSEMDVDDVESGTSILLSPSMDLSGYLNPKITSKVWHTGINQQQQSFDSIKVYISNGSLEKLAWFKKGNLFDWHNLSFNVKDFVPLTNNIRLRVVCSDNPNYTLFDSYETTFDNFKVTDQPLDATEPFAAVQLTAQPNPFQSSTQVTYDGVDHHSRLQVYDLLGQLLQSMELPGITGQVDIGQELGNGVYLLRLEQGGVVVKTMKVIKVD